MKRKIIIEYDVVWDSMTLNCGDFSTFETLALLEAAKAMVAKDWLDDPKNNDKGCRK